MLIRRIKTFSEEQKKSNLVAPGIAATGTALSIGGSTLGYRLGKKRAYKEIDNAVQSKINQVSADAAKSVSGVKRKWYDVFGIGKNRKISKIAQSASNKIKGTQGAGEFLKKRANSRLMKGALLAGGLGTTASGLAGYGVYRGSQERQYSEESERTKLKSVHARGKGMARATSLGIGSNVGGHLGRKAGIMKAKRSDKKGKSDLEIIEDASKTAGNVGTTTGLIAGGAVGAGAGSLAKKGLEEISEQAKTAKIDAKALKIGGKVTKAVGNALSNLPIIGRRYLIHPEKGKYTSGKIIGGIAEAAGKGAEKLAKVEDLAGKVQRGTKKAAVPVALGITALGAAHGAISGRNHAKSGAEKHTLARLSKRNKKDNVHT